MNYMRSAIAAASVSLMASLAWAQSGTMSAQDFATTAASSDMLEIQTSNVALQKSSSAAVKEFAQMMINDHTKASSELKMAAQKDGVTIPTAMLEKHAATVEKLNGTAAGAFDAAYIDAQVNAHKEAVALMMSYAQTGEAPALKAHAQKTAPIIQMHLQHAQQLMKAQ
ncbi:DUF4142 domain-containing protein [Mesorhizobium sp. BR1-1-16]|uniref:DUF4142 domain-containing protein n=1 Tax=Mesorhizobium sp. BR1-1-16 TaxID=2876653 RepID=UPI001CCD76AD|nr:DUF4142 domain-containing protein [Mesorhizobium sp. BR1-1-16]MBZ9936976.1 DUF4142 domain-containing protein [Mesorhizobium sp. BR1-1-16]